MSKLNTNAFIKSVFQKFKVGFIDDCTGVMYDSCTGNNMGFCNTEQSQSFTKNDCTSGKEGSNELYVVPANTYCMKPTLIEANQLALDDILNNGQNYANLNGVCTCTPCQFVPTIRTVFPSSFPDPLFYINDYSPLPDTYLGLPAVSISYIPSQIGFAFKIRGIKNEVFPITSMIWTGPGFGFTVIRSDDLSTCDGGFIAKQANDRFIDKSLITSPTLITATFNIPSCGGTQIVSFYILP